MPGFTGREAELEAVEAALWSKGGKAALTNTARVGGGEGAGRGRQVGAGAGVRLAQPRPLSRRVVDQGGEERDAARRPDRAGRAVHPGPQGGAGPRAGGARRARPHRADAGREAVAAGLRQRRAAGRHREADAGGGRARADHDAVVGLGQGGGAREDRRVSARCRGAVSAGQHRADRPGGRGEACRGARISAAGARSCRAPTAGARASASTRTGACRRPDPQGAERRRLRGREAGLRHLRACDPEGDGGVPGGGEADGHLRLPGAGAHPARYRDRQMS